MKIVINHWSRSNKINTNYNIYIYIKYQKKNIQFFQLEQLYMLDIPSFPWFETRGFALNQFKLPRSMTDNGDVQLAQPLPITKQAFHFPCYLPQQAEESDGEPVVIRMECLPLSSMQIIALHLLWKITVNLCLHSYRTQFLHTHTHTQT